MSPVLLGVLAYVLVQLGIGVVVARRVKDEEDYLVAGRSLGLGLATCSIFATWFGAETCVGAAGQIYTEGLDRHSVEPFAYGACLLLMGLFFAAPFWRTRITTLADLLRTRYSPGVERVAAVLLIPTSVLWAAAQVRAFGHVLAVSGGIGVELGIATAAGIAIVYTVAGGLLADVYTDVVQAFALVLGLVLVLASVVGDLGGVAGAGEAAAEALRRPPLAEPGASWLETAEIWAVPLCGSLVAQEVVSRSLAARSPAVARRSALLGGSLYLAVGAMPVFLGLVGSRLVPGLADPEQLLPELARRHLPTVGYVLFAGALVSAILSTVDSALLVASSLLSRNLVFSGRRGASDRVRLLGARAGVVLFGLGAWALAREAEGVFELVEDASGFGSAGILVVVAFGLFTRFGGPHGAHAALWTGVTVWVVGHYFGIAFPHPYLASLGGALAAFLALGALEKGPRPSTRPS